MKIEDFLKLIERFNLHYKGVYFNVESSNGCHMVQSVRSTDRTIIQLIAKETTGEYSALSR